MAQHRVTHIRKPNIHSTHEHITHIGNLNEKWIITREEAIRQIDSKTNDFYVFDPIRNKSSWVGVVRPTDGRKPFLRTFADGDWNDNLLSLPQC